MEQLKTAFVICSRSDSKRVPEKPLKKLNGVPLIEHLVGRCIATGYPVVVAIPHRDYEKYRFLKDRFDAKDFTLFCGDATDPLARMRKVCDDLKIDIAIRVCHDKVFIEPEAIKQAVYRFSWTPVDYIYSNTFVAGSAFEVISARAIRDASDKFKDVEHVSYAVRCVTDRIHCMDFSHLWKSDHRLLVDYPEDIKVLDLVLHSLGNNCTLQDAIQFLDQHQWISRINRTPQVTVYTCAYNAEKWLTKCMGSVSMQNIFGDCEYLIIDDSSSDSTSVLASKFCSIYKNARWIRNPKNMGLASSSNIALSEARGRYIIRLDADDYFIDDHSLQTLVIEAEKTGADIIYPDNYYGGFKKIQSGDEQHHVGGALFRTRAANHVKFTDGLRGYEGLDFFNRARNQLKISYLKKPTFFYRQHPGSMSKGDIDERTKQFQQIAQSSGSSDVLPVTAALE